jgi:hypothetical protein
MASAPEDLGRIPEHPVEAMFDHRSTFLTVIREMAANHAFLNRKP